MRRQHFDALQPICPRCALAGRPPAALKLVAVLAGTDDLILEGLLHCPDDRCRQEFPIIDGIPVIVADVRAYIGNHSSQILGRQDLSSELYGLLGDAMGPGSERDQTRQHLSIYTWGHYADLDPGEDAADGIGSLLHCIEQGLALPIEPCGPALDMGCSVGRSTFEIAGRIRGLALGVDLNFAMLRVAQDVLQTGRIRYDRRRLGMVYDRREFQMNTDAGDLVDFWACDVLALPFSAGQFGSVLAMNLLDCVASPRDLLAVLGSMLKPGGAGLFASPYDWSPNATAAEAWIGGHSQRGPDNGAAEPLLRALLTPGAHPHAVSGLTIAGEIENLPWLTRLHERSVVNYSTHLVAVRAAGVYEEREDRDC